MKGQTVLRGIGGRAEGAVTGSRVRMMTATATEICRLGHWRRLELSWAAAEAGYPAALQEEAVVALKQVTGFHCVAREANYRRCPGGTEGGRNGSDLCRVADPAATLSRCHGRGRPFYKAPPPTRRPAGGRRGAAGVERCLRPPHHRPRRAPPRKANPLPRHPVNKEGGE